MGTLLVEVVNPTHRRGADSQEYVRRVIFRMLAK